MKQRFDSQPTNTQMIEGRNAVHEALRAGRVLDKVFLSRTDDDSMLGFLGAKAKEAGAVVIRCDKRKLDQMSETGSHQGVIAFAAAREYATIEDVLARAQDSGRPPLIVICDEISDPHNLGAIIRSAEAAGAHGVIIPKRHNAGLTAVVEKASAGALEYMPIVRVPNLVAAMETLKEKGVWIYGTGLGATSNLFETDLTGPCAIVIGSEGDGIGRLVGEHCDFMMEIPMLGQIQSLNASAAAAVVLFETVRQRTAK
ncbi:MAG: 23S rRNA (guanosine(2251)-2'-O)-methyltransferase RlmB [Oscillospiraceae bacterium]|nr:23S rRNA (guanosine(2251)-2'-O)-methyltransferase RlmB [Oscillospiraceae bacterium]